MSDDILTVTTSQAAGPVTVLTAVGEFDRDSVKVVDEAVPGEAVRVVVDLTGVTFCDSGALNYLVQLHMRLAALGGALAIAGASGFVRRTLEVTNLDRLFGIFPTVDDAMRALEA